MVVNSEFFSQFVEGGLPNFELYIAEKRQVTTCVSLTAAHVFCIMCCVLCVVCVMYHVLCVLCCVFCIMCCVLCVVCVRIRAGETTQKFTHVVSSTPEGQSVSLFLGR